METEIKVSTKNLENAKNIKLSTNTHKANNVQSYAKRHTGNGCRSCGGTIRK